MLAVAALAAPFDRDVDAALLARTHAREGLALAEFDVAGVEGSRMVIDHLADRRPDAYGGAADVAAALGFGG